MFELAIFHIIDGATQIRYAGIYPTLAICEAAATAERRKFYLNDTSAVYRPWNYKTMCLRADRPRLFKTSDAAAQSFRLGPFTYTAKPALPERRDWRLVIVMYTDGAETVIRMPEIFRTAQGCTAAGALARTQHVLDVADGRQSKNTILSYRCEQNKPGIQT